MSTAPMTAQAIVPSFRPVRGGILFDLVSIVLCSALIAICAQLAIRIGPVPITGQTFAVLLVAAVLGRDRAVLAVAAYLLEGAAGLPVFANFGAGIPALIGPTAGYLAGFVVAAGFVGWMADHGLVRKLVPAAGVMTLGTAAIFACGLAWLAVLGTPELLIVGLWPFLPGAVIKIAAAALLLPVASSLVHRARR